MTPETISITPEMIAILAIGVALAGLMLRGHHGLGRRMDGFDSHIVGLEQRFDKRMDGFDSHIVGLEQRFDKRMDSFDSHIVGLEQRFDKRMDSFDSHIVGLEQRFDKRMDGLEQRFNERIDGLDKRMDGFDERLRSLENGQSELKGTILGKLELVERYILARNLPAGEPALRSGAGAD